MINPFAPNGRFHGASFAPDSLAPWQRLAAAVAGALIAFSLLFPLWQMTMVAPQYPEGLVLQVYANKLVGGASEFVDHLAEINTLNHYIGMAELHGESFPELRLMPLGMALAAVLAALAASGHRAFLGAGLAVLGIVGAGGLSTAAYRLYQYGHNLDPSAPVKIAPFTPVFLGTNQLANFTTTGSLGLGAYLLLAAAALGVVVLLARGRSNSMRQVANGKEIM